MILVENVVGSGDRRCKCGTWLEHWRKYATSGQSTWCNKLGCLKSAKVGAHVRRVLSPPDRTEYIVPLCYDCNQDTTPFYVAGSLVAANVSNTCGKAA